MSSRISVWTQGYGRALTNLRGQFQERLVREPSVSGDGAFEQAMKRVANCVAADDPRGSAELNRAKALFPATLVPARVAQLADCHERAGDVVPPYESSPARCH